MEQRTTYYIKSLLFHFAASLIRLFIATAGAAAWQYSWVEWDDSFDCIVGITVDGNPVSTGVIVGVHIVLTSANPIESASQESIQVHTINTGVNQSKSYNIMKVERETSMRTRYWQDVGVDDQHSPIHDLIVLHLSALLPVFFPGQRIPIVANLNIGKIQFVGSELFTFAGFGFVDMLHVEENFDLEPVYYTVGNVLEDCDEWIPRSWGRFICIRNIENFIGISSGSGLFYQDNLVGIGSFALAKGNESILLFTDIRQYWHSLWGNVFSFLHETNKWNITRSQSKSNS